MARKKGGGHGGGHGWFVTFADLMGLLMSFFVMLVAFSTQDANKLKIVAGSMRDAFGMIPDSRLAGIIEKDGVPLRSYLKNAKPITIYKKHKNPINAAIGQKTPLVIPPLNTSINFSKLPAFTVSKHPRVMTVDI